VELIIKSEEHCIITALKIMLYVEQDMLTLSEHLISPLVFIEVHVVYHCIINFRFFLLLTTIEGNISQN